MEVLLNSIFYKTGFYGQDDANPEIGTNVSILFF